MDQGKGIDGARGVAMRALAGFLLLASVAAALVVFGHRRSLRDPRTPLGLRVLGEEVGRLDDAELAAKLRRAVDRALEVKIDLVLGETGGAVPRSVSRRQLGLRIDLEALVERAHAYGRSGELWRDVLERMRARRGHADLTVELRVDPDAAREALVDLKDEIDRAAVDAHMDLDGHRVTPERPGCLLKVYDALVALGYLARAGVDGPRTLSLGTSLVPARVTAAGLAEVDISTVLGTWETHYSSVGVDSDRTYNLKVGADHLNGHILLPGALFSFNEVVGDRSEKEGYRVAPVIAGGELIDGLAGGMCQIASTLHGAAFFGGLEIVSSTPHSRPSSYIPLGLDSTVVYPTTDLKLKNTYPFPVVMHYTVNQGTVKVELLGKARPNRVIFEREIRGETSFGTATRRDPSAPEGQRLTLQEGYPGYSLVRRRYVFEGTPPKIAANETVEQALQRLHVKPLSKKEWPIHYPATESIVAIGSGPRTLKKKEPPPAHRIPPLRPEEKGVYRLIR